MSFAQPFQDYEILDRVGAGAMGTVFKARQKRLSRMVAIKVLKPSLARDERYVDRLRREARIVAALNHPHIVAGYDLGEEAGYHFFVMEFVEGKSLRALLAERGTFPEDQVCKVARQAAEALDHALERGVIHRDIKPGNILIDDQGNVKLTDMGLAKGPADLTLTRDGATVGTPQYISPEQARNPHDVDVRSDLYSLGATLYHMATGQPPFRGETMAEVITKVLHETPAAPRDVEPSVSEGLSLVIRKPLAKNLQVRYQTPRELLDDLDRLDAQQPVAIDESRLVAGDVEAPQSPLLWIGVVVAACLLFGGALWLGMQLGPEQAASGDGMAYVRRLETDLAGLPTFDGRLARLREAITEAPGISIAAVRQRQQSEVRELQRSVDDVVARLAVDLTRVAHAWLGDPTRWPSRWDYVREVLDPALLQGIGAASSRLPAELDTRPIDRLLADVDRMLQQRDLELQNVFLRQLDVVLPSQVDRLLRAWDFTAAARLVDEAMSRFFDGVQHPLVEKVDPKLAAQWEQRFETRADSLRTQIGAVEAGVAAALRTRASNSVADLRAAIAREPDPVLMRERVAHLRQTLKQEHPDSSSFRANLDPWPDVEAALRPLEEEAEALLVEARRRERERVLDLAWLAFTAGGSQQALAVLGTEDGSGADAERWRAHRHALGAAAKVADVVLRCLSRKQPPVLGHPRDGVLPVDLRVVFVAGEPQLMAQPAGGASRQASLVEFRFAELYELAREASPELLRELAPAELELGVAILKLCGDEVPVDGATGLDPFLRDEVWERIVRVRGDATATSLSRVDAYRHLRQAWDRAQRSRELGELERALAAWRLHQGAATPEEANVGRAAERWLERERRAQTTEAELRATLQGAGVAVRTVAGQLQAIVGLSADALRRGMREGWQPRDGALEYGGHVADWEAAFSRRLEVDAGLPSNAEHAVASVDISVPRAGDVQRVYVFEFRGVGCVLVALPDDGLVAAFVDDVRNVASVRAACQAALQTALSGSVRARLIAEATHRLRFEVGGGNGRSNVRATVSVDEQQLCSQQINVGPKQPPTLRIVPLQDLVVHRAELTATWMPE